MDHIGTTTFPISQILVSDTSIFCWDWWALILETHPCPRTIPYPRTMVINLFIKNQGMVNPNTTPMTSRCITYCQWLSCDCLLYQIDGCWNLFLSSLCILRWHSPSGFTDSLARMNQESFYAQSSNQIWVFPKIMGNPPKSSILIGFSIINHPFWGISPYFWKHPYWPKKGGMVNTRPGVSKHAPQHPKPLLVPGRWCKSTAFWCSISWNWHWLTARCGGSPPEWFHAMKFLSKCQTGSHLRMAKEWAGNLNHQLCWCQSYRTDGLIGISNPK